MLRLIFVFIGNTLGNILLLPINIILLIPRLVYKLIINNKAGVWISVGKSKHKGKITIETSGDIKVKGGNEG